ncbi:ADP-ribosylation factor-binding protein GGA1 isoform X1 [Neodiprion fabricii]|uniref:ADP-ribosylation factor-binding protein GGA1 isoform X1 n=1 Tax=Neodiprion fabricii TaxID=2872261 RepID=UPI001ED917B5|nr:ADP-ribosylation factor-binding protein GGA1 isoform X1 [Neodiprion fabricii]
MDVVTTSLEALIQRVTNPQNQFTDVAAIEAFCVMLGKESEGAHIASKLLATHIQSPTEWEALQALELLDACMKRCGSSFHAEVGKFRFLNEMIKLVSPKYLGSRTPANVQQMVLQLLCTWTQQYPGEVKIKEAYDMLKKQGVVKEDIAALSADSEDSSKSSKSKHPIFEDDEKSKLLQKLLQSKNPDDLLAANRLIKTMVKEDERRVQQNSRRIMELESVHNNVRLLSEMLDSFNKSQASADDLELMKELYQACERLRPNVFRLANESQDNQEMLNEVLAANDELGQVFDKYIAVIVLGQQPGKTKSNATNGSSLLDLSASNELDLSAPVTLPVNKANESDSKNSQTDLEMLGDIFSSLEATTTTATTQNTPSLLSDASIMQPVSISPLVVKAQDCTNTEKVDSKSKALEDLDALGESLLKQNLTSFSAARTQFNNISKPPAKVPMNSMAKPPIEPNLNGPSTVSLTSEDSALVDLMKGSRLKPELVMKDQSHSSLQRLPNGDDSLVDISDITQPVSVEVKHADSVTTKEVKTTPVSTEPEIKPLTDINVTLETIKPGTIPPLMVIDEKNAISVVLHFARDSPRPDVSVIVVTTMSKNSNPLTNYLFQAVVPKTCKCRLQPPSGTNLPAHNPFLPPSAITQIMLIANPNKISVSLKFMLSYTMEDETVTEMGEVDKLPIA